MAWLIRERRRLQGEIDRTVKLLDELPGRLEALKAQMESLDGVFPLHSVQVDPTIIKGKQKKAPALFDHGVMTKGILECLRLANGKSRYSGEIAAHVARFAGFEIKQSNKAYLMGRVSQRLNAMTREGLVSRHHDMTPGCGAEGQWALIDEAPSRVDLKVA